MKIVELVTAAKATSPKSFGKVPDARAVKIASAVLAEIGKRIDATAEGPVPVVRFGRFVVKRIAAKPAGAVSGGAPSLSKAQEAAVRRVLFQRAKPAAKTVTLRR